MLGLAGRRCLAVLALAAALLLAQAPALAEPHFPTLTGHVTDAANVIPPDVEARLDQKLAALETQKGYQLVVVTLPSLGGYDIADYGYQLGRHWGIGSKERNDGALLIVAPIERKLRIEVGYGLEGVLTDGMTSLIIGQTIVPRLKAGDLPGGIEAGTDAIIQQLGLPPDQARAVAQQAAAAPPESKKGGLPVVFLMLIFFFFVLPMLRSLLGGRGRRSSGFPGVMVWPGGGFGGGGFGGGGFGGGGGSFGGGGSSGSW